MKKLLVLLVLVVLGVLVFNHFYDDGGQVWFDDFRGMMTYDDDVKQAAVDYVLGGTGEGLSMNGPHIVFLTVFVIYYLLSSINCIIIYYKVHILIIYISIILIKYYFLYSIFRLYIIQYNYLINK